MKLHIPFRLRKALLACLAATSSALPNTLCFTSWATGVFLSGLVAFSGFQHASADFPGPPNVNWSDAGVLECQPGEDCDVSDEANHQVFTADVIGGGDPLVFYGGEGCSLKLTKTGANTETKLGDDLEDHALLCTNLWLTDSASSGNNHRFTITNAGYLANVGNIYVNSCGLFLNAAITFNNTNFILGSNDKPTGNTGVTETNKNTLWVHSTCTTQGSLTIQEDALIFLNNSFTVHHLNPSSGKLRLAGGQTLILSASNMTMGFGRSIEFVPHNNLQPKLNVGNNNTLVIRAIEGNVAGATITGENSTIQITGTGSVSNLTLGGNITLNLQAGARQTFEGINQKSVHWRISEER